MKERIVMIVGMIVIVLFIINAGLVFYFHKQHNDNINNINQQNWLTKIKVENMEKNSDSFRETLETMNTQFKNYDENLATIEKRVGTGETLAKDISSKMQSIRLDIEDWQKKYATALKELTELKNKTDSVIANIAQLKKETGNVDLGRISVEGQTEGRD